MKSLSRHSFFTFSFASVYSDVTGSQLDSFDQQMTTDAKVHIVAFSTKPFLEIRIKSNNKGD